MPPRKPRARPALIIRIEASDDMAAALVIAARAFAAAVASTAEADALLGQRVAKDPR